MEQEVVLHMPLKRVIILIKHGGVKGERQGERVATARKKNGKVSRNIW